MIKKRYKTNRSKRDGGAVVEAALVLPVLIVLTLGVIDIAQYINLAQIVSNASRESARIASREEITSASQVESATEDYLGDMFPNVSESDLQEAVTVIIRNSEGTTITDLGSVETGAKLSAYIKFDFEAIRWLNGLDYWSGSADQETTVFRRE